MKLILDEREADLYDKCYSILYTEETKLQANVQLSKKVLELGDALIASDDDVPLLLIERKSFSDLLASIKDGRYEEQSYRITHTWGLPMHNVIYILEGVFSQLKNPKDKKMIYSAMTSLNYFKGFSVMKTSSVRETAELVVYMADKIMRTGIKSPLLETKVESAAPDYCNVVKKTKKDNITADNIGQIILSQIPGIGAAAAISIMKGFHSFPHFMQSIRENPSLLENIRIESGGKTRKLGKNCIQSIHAYLIASAAPSTSDNVVQEEEEESDTIV